MWENGRTIVSMEKENTLLPMVMSTMEIGWTDSWKGKVSCVRLMEQNIKDNSAQV